VACCSLEAIKIAACTYANSIAANAPVGAATEDDELGVALDVEATLEVELAAVELVE